MKELIEIASVICAVKTIYDIIYAMSDFLAKVLTGS